VVVLERWIEYVHLHPHGPRQATLRIIRYAKRVFWGNDSIQSLDVFAYDGFPEFFFHLAKLLREARIDVRWRRQFRRRLSNLSERGKSNQESADKCDTGHGAPP
jgi:hypothetical protein